MNYKGDIPSAVIRRLPRYYRYLTDLLNNDIQKVSSRELSERMGFTASQIRQDFNYFGGFGQQGYGYNVQYLYKEIGAILGVDKKKTMVIIGAGNLGRALANYMNFRTKGFELVGIFDVKKELIGQDINGIRIKCIDEIDEFINHANVDIGVLSVPYDQAADVADKLVNCGIRALWNFSPMDLQLPQGVVVENVHLSDSLMVLSFMLSQLQTGSDKMIDKKSLGLRV